MKVQLLVRTVDTLRCVDVGENIPSHGWQTLVLVKNNHKLMTFLIEETDMKDIIIFKLVDLSHFCATEEPQ